MQFTSHFVGRVSHAALCGTLVVGVGTTASLGGCVAVRSTLARTGLPVAPATFQDPRAALPDGVDGRLFALLWARMSYQRTNASCSVATVTLAVNGLRAARGLAPVTQESVVATDASGRWWNATQADANGVTLDAAHLLCLGALANLGDVPRDRHVGVQVVHVPPQHAPAKDLGEAERALAFALGRMGRAPGKTLVLVNFSQGRLVASGAHEGHLSIVGAFDAARSRVLVLDVDTDRMRPYWVPLSALLAAMQVPDDVTGEPRGYLVVDA